MRIILKIQVTTTAINVEVVNTVSDWPGRCCFIIHEDELQLRYDFNPGTLPRAC